MSFKKEKYLCHYVNREQSFFYYDIEKAAKDFGGNVRQLPYSIRVLLESVIRQFDGKNITIDHIKALIHWKETQEITEYPFKPMRVVLQRM